jgi:hypothetical protein
MQFLDKWERKFGWLSFPGILRYYALLHVLVFFLQFINKNIGALLEFDREKILAGEVWRTITFLFASSGSKDLGTLSILFLFFMVMIAFMMSDALEAAWGIFRSSCYHYAAFIGLMIANWLYPQTMPNSGLFVYTSAFFAFATLFPRQEFMMFFVIPVQVRWLAALTALLLLSSLISQPAYIGFLVLSFGNYLLWAGIPALRGQLKAMKAEERMKKFIGDNDEDSGAFHRCSVCGRTEVSHPECDFRMAVDGKEYCQDHLPE